MAQLSVDNVVRYTIKGRWSSGRPIVNLMDMHVEGAALGSTRDDQIVAVAEDVRNAWQDHIIPNISSSYTMEGVDYLDMNGLNGIVGSVLPDVTRPLVGGQQTDSNAPNVSAVIEKQTGGGRRGEKPGRMFLAGLGDARVDNNGIILAIWRQQLDEAFQDFLESIDDGGVAEVPHYPVVVHVKSETATRVTGFVTQPIIGQQRRRLRG